MNTKILLKAGKIIGTIGIASASILLDKYNQKQFCKSISKEIIKEIKTDKRI